MLRRARYGLPPPPVPRIQAPMARFSISSGGTGLIATSASESRELLESHEARDAQDEREGYSDGEGGHRGRGGVEGILEIGEELDRERGQLRAGQEEREGEVVEGDGEGENRARHHARLDQDQGDLEERAHRVRAQALGRLLERDVEVGEGGGDGSDHVRGGHHDVADEERGIGGLHPEERVELEEGDPGEDLRQEQRRGHEGVEEIPATEVTPYERDGGRRPDHGGGQSCPHRELGGEPEGLHELPALEEVGEPLQREALGGEGEVVARVEGGEHHDDHGEHEEGVDHPDHGAQDHTMPRSARSVTLMYTPIRTTEITRSTKALAAPKGQSKTESTCSYTTMGSTWTLKPPTRMGTTNELMASEKTRSEPARIPGSDRGRVTSKKARGGDAPSVCEASMSSGSMRFSTPVSDSTMKGRKTCTRARVTPNLLYMRGSGLVSHPPRTSVSLMRPRSARRIIQP